jgi:hypothetical protein
MLNMEMFSEWYEALCYILKQGDISSKVSTKQIGSLKKKGERNGDHQVNG